MQKVIINPGSGGSDSGNVSSNLIEKDFNLEIAKAIYDNLKDLGIDAYLLRDSDETLSNSERLRKVESLINEGDTVILLTNVLSGGNDSGAEIIYALKDEDKLASMISNNIESIGQEGDILTSKENEKIYMDGKKIYKYAITKVAQNINKLLEENKLDISEIKYIIPH